MSELTARATSRSCSRFLRFSSTVGRRWPSRSASRAARPSRGPPASVALIWALSSSSRASTVSSGTESRCPSSRRSVDLLHVAVRVPERLLVAQVIHHLGQDRPGLGERKGMVGLLGHGDALSVPLHIDPEPLQGLPLVHRLPERRDDEVRLGRHLLRPAFGLGRELERLLEPKLLGRLLRGL